MLPYLLHHANRAINDVCWGKDEFYIIKDRILQKHGKHIEYDVQKIPGKECWTCGGTGIYTGFYEMSGEMWQDTCNRCFRGWYILPKWICLSRIKFGRYFFHKPLKREQCINNPFTLEGLGWQVTQRPIIQGYIDHTSTVLGKPSILILFYLYDRKTYNRIKNEVFRQMRWEWTWIWRGFIKKFRPHSVHNVDNDFLMD